MFNTIKTVLANPPSPPNSLFPRSLSSISPARETSTIRFCTKPDNSAAAAADHKMENQAQKPKEETAHGDVMSHSFGEGYATRSDEEGFGGIYGANQSLPTNQQDKSAVHENHPDYDKTQGSEVKEKEKARHQTSANA